MTTFIETDFTFNSVNSNTYGIKIVKVQQSSMIGTPISGGKTVEQTFVSRRDKPYFYGTTMQPQELNMTFMCSTPNSFTSNFRKSVFEWLYGERKYCDFISNDNTDKVYKIIFTSPLQFSTVNLLDGYFDLSAIAYPFAYTTVKSYNYKVASTPTEIIINNLTNVQNYDGTFNYYPIIYADLTGSSSSIKLVNKSDNNRIFEITSLNTLEELYIDNNLKIINSSVSNANRFENLINKQWFRLVKGENKIDVYTTCNLNIQCQYPILV